MPLNPPRGNMYPWAYTWNPLGGKCPHACQFCYVGGKIAPWLERMGNDKYVGEPRLIEEEFNTKLIVPSDYVVFVESCGDLFAQEINEKWVRNVLVYLKRFPDTTFLLQTKNPERFLEFDWRLYPPQCILGTTIETNRDYHLTNAPSPYQRYEVFHDIIKDACNLFHFLVSIEPVMDFDFEIMKDWMRTLSPDITSIGADSGHNNLPEPNSTELQRLIMYCTKFSDVRVKKNLSRLLA